jgi:flagellar biosynthetic protein FliQ
MPPPPDACFATESEPVPSPPATPEAQALLKPISAEGPVLTDTTVVHIALQTMMIAVKLGAPVLMTALVIGFAVSIFQSVTQIQEQTLSFVPKAIGVGVALLVSGNWMLHELISFTTGLYGQIPHLIGSA